MKKVLFRLITVTCFIFLSFYSLISYGQEQWTDIEKKNYSTLKNLAQYVYGKQKTEISNDTLFQKYVYFDYVLKDTLDKRREERLVVFDTLFYFFKKIVDSIGLNNLDAKPVRFYKNHEIYAPFNEATAKKSMNGKKMYTKDTNVFTYYRKEEPENPLGTLLFEPETNKLVAWIMVNQGGYKYFLTFNLL